jgi:hypothetical protein
MKLFYVIGVLLSVLLLSGCEKGIGTSESDQGAPEVGITAEAKQGALKVAEAQKATLGSQICVKGFIVAATTRSMTNAEFSAPFTGNTALVLASKKSDGTAEQFTNDESKQVGSQITNVTVHGYIVAATSYGMNEVSDYKMLTP